MSLLPKLSKPLKKKKPLEKLSFVSDAQETLKRQGLLETPEPNWGRDQARIIPSDVVDIPLKTLGKYHGATVSWLAYSNGVLAQVEARLVECKEKVDELLDRYRYFQPAKTPLWKLKAGLRKKDETFDTLCKKQTYLEAKKLLMKGVAEGYRLRAEYLSRELTRRQVEAGLSGRVT